MKCVINGISHKGEGIARIDGKAVFVPFAIPGETVDIKITERKKSYDRAELVDILEYSPYRIEPLCPHYYYCGGCSYQHITYEKQLQLKHQVVQDNLKRIGKLNVEVKPVIGSKGVYRYRNKVTWHLDKEGRLGYYQAGSNKLIEITTCKLISERMEKVTNEVRQYISSLNLGSETDIIIRESSVDGAIMLVINNVSVKINEKKFEELAHMVDSLIINYKGSSDSKVAGDSKLHEQVQGIRLSLSPGSFFQVNHSQMERLINIVDDYLELNENDTLLDAYCGVGSISLALAHKVTEVVGIESYAPAIRNAKNNALINGYKNCEFIAGPCEQVLPRLNRNFNKIIIDPPRSGLKREVIEAIIKANPQKIAYVSCNPSTLARDLAVLKEFNYLSDSIQPLDMFAQTHHVECVVQIKRAESRMG